MNRRKFFKTVAGSAIATTVAPLVPIPSVKASTIFPEFDPAIHVVLNEAMRKEFAHAFFFGKPIKEMSDDFWMTITKSTETLI